MLSPSQALSEKPIAIPQGEISAADLLAGLEPHRARPLVFNYEGRDVLPGYHVTEVKTGSFQALDCGANYETWHETFIQLWDVPPENDRGFMPVAKFLAIIGKASAAVPFDRNAKLTFEVSDGKRAMQLYRASALDIADDAVRITLSQRPASCKPRDRWLEQQKAGEQPCCNAPHNPAQCCN
jgi:hypothetical protein